MSSIPQDRFRSETDPLDFAICSAPKIQEKELNLMCR